MNGRICIPRSAGSVQPGVRGQNKKCDLKGRKKFRQSEQLRSVTSRDLSGRRSFVVSHSRGWGDLYGLRNLCDGAELTQRCIENHLCRVILCDANIRGPIGGVNGTIHLDNAQAVVI